ncbi:lysozyme [Campylobacterota bacterium]|nr:lysozyme [Campylobacterota bacterium]
MTKEAARRCEEQIKKHEALRLKAYRDSLGNWTIGYGHCDRMIADGDTITKEKAEELFVKDFVSAYFDAKRLVCAAWDAMGDARQAAIVSMSFNMGFSGLKGFAKMIGALEAKDYQKAADEMLASKWAKQTGKRAIELSQQMRTGEWQK